MGKNVSCHREMILALVKEGKEDFIQDYCNKSLGYCNRGEKLNPTPVKQKTEEFLNAGMN